MTRSATGTVDEQGRGIAQKLGLNRSILSSACGETKLFTKYKALAAGKLCIEVPAYKNSQECLACGHTHADNRLDQSRFVCQRCGHAENADTNAARVIARRGVERLHPAGEEEGGQAAAPTFDRRFRRPRAGTVRSYACGDIGKSSSAKAPEAHIDEARSSLREPENPHYSATRLVAGVS